MLAEVLLRVAFGDLQELQEELRKLLLDRPGSIQERLSVHPLDANGASSPEILSRILGEPHTHPCLLYHANFLCVSVLNEYL
jgi:hypothetical protein